jgi:acyl carrier protein
MTQPFTFTDLRAVIDDCVGVTEAVRLTERTLHADFADLGLDSLAVYEITSTLQERLHITIPDADLDVLTTPANVIDYVNRTKGLPL